MHKIFSQYTKRFTIALLIVHAGAACGGDIFEAVKSGNAEQVAHVLHQNPEALYHTTGHNKNTPLHVAAKHGHVEVMRLLLRTGADVNARNEEWHIPYWDNFEEIPLCLAVRAHQHDAVVCLVQHGADLNPHRAWSHPVEAAIWHGQFDIARYLLRHGAKIREKFLSLRENQMRTKWPDFDWHADKAQFVKARTDCLMDQLGIPKDIAILILVIEGVVPPRPSECVGSGSE